MESHAIRRFPKGFFNIFGAEFSARFCFWAVQSIIVLFLTKQFLISDSLAYSTAASYEALTYAATFIGGLLADRYFGPLKILIIGIIFSIIGVFLLAFLQQTLCYAGLALLVVGMGLYMPTNASLLDHLYEQGDTARESGYFYFYVATNIGGILGPILFGFLSQYYSYAAGFVICGVLLLAMLAVYLLTMSKIKYFRLDGEATTAVSLKKILVFAAGLIVLAMVCFSLIKKSDLTKDLLFIVGSFAIVWILLQSRNESAEARKKVFLILCFSIISLFFFAVEFQILNSVITFTRDFVDKQLGPLNIPTSAFVSLEPLFVVLMSPVINSFLVRVSKSKKEISVYNKFALSFASLAISFLILCLAAWHYSVTHQLISSVWLVVSAFFMGVGEVFLMPVLLALVTKDSPAKLKSSMVGFLYLAIAFSSYLSGVIANLTKTINAKSAIAGYSQTYLVIFFCMMGMSVVLWLFGKRMIKKAG